MNVDDAKQTPGTQADLPDIQPFIATHDPDIEPDYVNLPTGIEAVDLVASSQNQDYVNLADTGTSPAPLLCLLHVLFWCSGWRT